MNSKLIPRGFTLIELMVVVAVVAILATIAYPSYQSHMRQSRRSDAQIALVNVANLQERFFTQCNKYATDLTSPKSCDDSKLGVSSLLSPNGYYQLGLVNASTTSFTISAAPVVGSPQAGDTECTALTLTNAGVKGATGSNPSRCWRK